LRQFIKTKTFRIAAVVALLLGLYAIAGFVLAPKLARNALLTDIPKTLVGVTPTVGDIHINPFLLQVEVKDFYLTGTQGTKLVGLPGCSLTLKFLRSGIALIPSRISTSIRLSRTPSSSRTGA